MRIAMGIEYDGTGYFGWQRQREVNSIQGELEKALSQVANAPVEIFCAGRTDAGVHGTGQVIHFDTEAVRDMRGWIMGTNSNLPTGIAVRWAQPVSDEFHARFSARGRRYRYLLLNRPQRPGLWQGRVGWYHGELDLAAMQDAAARFLGEHDFSAFRAAECQAKSPIKTMSQATVRRCGPVLVFDFAASAFLHHMVRNLVGTLVHIGKGAQPASWADELLQMQDRKLAAPTFAPDGLYFRGPVYEPHWQLPDPADDLIDAFLL